MVNLRQIEEYITRFLFLLFAIISILATQIVTGGAFIIGLLVISFFSLIIFAKFDGIKVTLGKYSLDLSEGLSNGYEGLIEHANEYSTSAAQSLLKIQQYNDSGDPFHDLARIIDNGIEHEEQTGIDKLLNELKTNIATRKYVDEVQDPSMKVVRFQEDDLHVNSSGKEEFLKSGMKFRIYRETTQLSDGSAEDVTDSIGVASVVLVSKGTTQMKMERWGVTLDNPEIKEIRSNELKGKKLYADIYISESVEKTPLTELEQAYQQLKTNRAELWDTKHD